MNDSTDTRENRIRLGRRGISKQILLGARETNEGVDYLKAFVEQAPQMFNPEVLP